MRLRSNYTSHKRSTRRRLRMALAMALTAAPMAIMAAPGMVCTAEKLPCSLNQSDLDHPQHCEAGLLPYPFAPVSKSDGAKPQEKLERLVTLVGLHRANAARQSSAASCEVAQATLNQASLPAMHLPAMPSQVVSASGTQAIGPDSGDTLVPALPTLPESSALPEPSALPTAQASQLAIEAADELSLSLIDIAIPLDTLPTAQPSQLSEAAAISLEAPSLEAAPPDRRPELIQPAKSLSLSVRQPSSQSVSMSLNDAAEPASPQVTPPQVTPPQVTPPQVTPPQVTSPQVTPPQATPRAASSAAQSYALTDASLDDMQAVEQDAQPERGVSLHLSSASQVPMKTASIAASKSKHSPSPQPGGGMQVRIEGEPAPMLKGHFAGDLSRLAPAAPLPSMAGTPRNAIPVRAELYEPNNKVKAAFATRTSIIPDRDLERSMNTLGRGSKQLNEPLTVGLQESQTLSAQFVITELSVEHPSICQLMQTGESSVSLVGIRPGSTRIALVMVNDAGERQVEIHDVSVTSASTAARSLADLAADISRTVGALVPNSDVEIVAYEDYLLVHGFTHYESDAKKILSLVRKTSLVPVVDQLKSNDQ